MYSYRKYIFHKIGAHMLKLKFNELQSKNGTSTMCMILLVICTLNVFANPNKFETEIFRIMDDSGIFATYDQLNNNGTIVDKYESTQISNLINYIEEKNKSINFKGKIINGDTILDFDQVTLITESVMDSINNEIEKCVIRDVAICCGRMGVSCSLKGRNKSVLSQIKTMNKFSNVYYMKSGSVINVFVLVKSRRNCINHYFVKTASTSDMDSIIKSKNSFYMGYSTLDGFCDIYQLLRPIEFITDTNDMNDNERRIINELNKKRGT